MSDTATLVLRGVPVYRHGEVTGRDPVRLVRGPQAA